MTLFRRLPVAGMHIRSSFKMIFKLPPLLLLGCLISLVFGSPANFAADPPQTVKLDEVVQEVKGALSDYQKEVSASPDDLLTLKSADFDFKTVIQKQVTGGFSILIFTFKGSKTGQQTSDLQFHYEVPKPVGASSYTPVPIRQALLELIRKASQTIQSSKDSDTLGNMKITNVSISIEYAVTYAVSAEGKPVVQFVTLDIAGSYSKNEVQSIKLVFERKA